ncbi:hypothetical protein QAD02_004454 [Eretmocerus hayati]|uniref:Uncharacterized protein n=1 Tax=Eretmocerus hayati TaxID=131215 RepID=A0ACC2NPZ9_9HYME|nr:hypothetical protein QAD02_004454 [Eretmocerus hayati]
MRPGEARVKVLFFAKARELAGRRYTELTLPSELTSAQLKDRLVQDFNLHSIQHVFVLALNETFVEPDARLCLVEMANKKDFIGFQATKLDVNAIIEIVVSPECGAVSSFIGTTRNNFEKKKVVKLEYEAYQPMALKEMQAVCKSIRSQWEVEKIAIYHRLGEVPVMEASIVIAVSSPHRKESLQAVDYAINALKSSVPIWKKEVYENDEPSWKENRECMWATTK